MTETRAADTAPAALPAKRDAPWRKLLRGLGWTFIVFGYVLLGSIAMVLTMAAGERIRADCSVVDDRHRD